MGHHRTPGKGKAPHDHPDERGWFDQVVDACGCPKAQHDSFVGYAAEMTAVLRRGYGNHVAEGVKKVAMKWWLRGLCGRKLWEVYQELKKGV